MPLSPAATLLVTETSATNKASHTTASFAPTANALIAVFASAFASGSDTLLPFAISDDFADVGTWTQHEVEEIDIGNSGVFAAWTATAGASPGSGTVTLAPPRNAVRWTVIIVEVEGHDTTTPVPQSTKLSQSTGATLTVTLAGTPAADSMVLAGIAHNDDSTPNNIAPGTGFTEVTENNTGQSNSVTSQVQYDIDDADTTADWSNLNANRFSIGIALEVAAAAEAGSILLQMMHHYHGGS